MRKRDTADESEEPLSECPFCSALGPCSDLQCSTCQNVIPYCIATGNRMTAASCAQCPSCRFPCEPEAFARAVGDERICPMCNQEVVLAAVQRMDDPMPFLRALSKAEAQ